MWGQFSPHVILLILIYVFNASCQEKGSLTFVIDNTLSMTGDINAVKKSADDITKIVFDEISSQIKNMVLVTFNDPKAKLETDTDKRDEFKTKINNVFVHNNYGNRDWPEPSMNGILMGLKNSLQGSFLFVFTDASAKDAWKSAEVKNLCQKKQSQIIFILTGNWKYIFTIINKNILNVYYEIAKACSGFVIMVDKSNIDKALVQIRETITGKKAVLTAIQTPADVYTNVPFTIDDQTEYAIVTATGLDVTLKVIGPRASQEQIMWLPHAKSIKLTDPSPGQYTATVMSGTETSVHIVGRTDFTFNHGFSTLEPKTIKDTIPQPFANTATHLSISVTDKKHTVNILSAQILNMNENVLNTLPLRAVSEDFYTTTSFVAPSERFKVAVIGKAVRNGKEIRRIAKIPITPPDPPIVLPDPKAPVVSISEGSQTEVEYGKTVKLTCKVSAYPKPTISWKNSHGTTLKSESAIVDEPYDYISYLTIPDIKQRELYTCYVASKGHKPNEKTIDVTVKEPFDIKSTVQGITGLQYGKKGTLKCDIRASVPIRIYWQYMETKGKSTPIVTSNKYTVSADGTQLDINKMDFDMVGKYSCTAFVEKDPRKMVTFDTRVKATGLELSVLSKNVENEVLKGSNVDIKCHITGVPEPTITWQFMRKDDSKFVSISGSENVLHKSNVDVKDAGQYMCLAHNVVGNKNHTTTLTVQVLPSITSSIFVFDRIEGKDKILRLPCTATGLPKPDISWKIKGKAIAPNEKYSIEDGTLVIKDPTVADSLILYNCEAKNNAGSVDANFQVHVYQIPKILGKETETIIKGNPVNIVCNVPKGVPKPIITWQFMAKGDSKYVSIAGSKNVLTIASVKEKDDGRYKCIAHNSVGDDEHVTKLTVQVPPKIISSTSVVFKSVEDRDALLRIPCITSGDPKPVITWTINGLAISPSSKYVFEDGALIIKDPKVSDSHKYTCEAKNDAGSVHETFQAEILQTPKVSGQTSMTVKTGDTVDIKCIVVKGVPRPRVTWEFRAKDDTKFVPVAGTDNVLRKSSVDRKNDGHYKCIAYNSVAKDEHITKLNVEFAPIITKYSKTFKGLEEDVGLKIPCDVIGLPKPVITWKLDGDVIIPDGHYTIVNEALHIKGPKNKDSNTYSCEAKNYLGTDEATFTVKIDSSLGDYGNTSEVHILDGTSKKLECGSAGPDQNVRWFKGGIELNVTTKYINIVNIDVTQESNYTCRVSDINGGHTNTYEIVVGVAPTFQIEQESPIFDWNDSEDDKLFCQFQAIPAATIEWTYNGKVLKLSDKNSSHTLDVSGKWGNYTCTVTNVHGTIQRSFDVISTNCLISRKLKSTMPLILTTESTWPILDSTKDYLVFNPGETILFNCLNQKGGKNNFKSFPTLNEISASCEKQDVFRVNGKSYQVSDFECAHEVNSVTVKNEGKCLTESSELLRVGYDVHGFLETYAVCFDKSKNMPLYTRVVMSKSNLGQGETYDWNKYSGIGDGKENKRYTCKNSNSSCCYSKQQLVNARDFIDGPAQRSTFIDPLNAVPYWRPCNKEDPWSEIESRVRSQLSAYDQFNAWSGTHKLQKIDGQIIPHYLWKVLNFGDGDSIAIVYVNAKSFTNADILCENKFNSVSWLGSQIENTYSCDVDEFLQAFGLRKTTIGE